MLKFKLKVKWILEGRNSTSAMIQTFLARFLILSFNILCGMLTARFLGASGRGEQAAMLLWSNLLAGSLTFGLPWALVFHIKRAPEQRSEYFTAALLMSTVSGIIAVALGIAIIPTALQSYNPQTVRMSQWLMLAALPGLVSLTLNAAFDAEERFSFSNLARYSMPAGTFVLLLVFAGSNLLTPVTAALSYLAPSLPISLWMLQQLLRDYRPRWTWSFFYYKSLLSYGLRAYGADLLTALSGQLSQVVIVSLLLPSAMGLYTVAFSFSRMLNLVQASIATVLFPKTSACGLSENLNRTAQAVRIGLILMLPLVGILGFSGSWLLGFIYGDEFRQAAPVFQILLVEVILMGVALLFSQAYMSAGRPEFVTLTQAIGITLGIPLTLVLTGRYGLIGAAVATLLSTSIRLLWLWFSFSPCLKMKFPSLWFCRADWLLLKRIAVRA